MNAKDKAKKLIETHSKFVNGYIGSSMLTNTEYPEQIKDNAKRVSIILIDEMLYELRDLPRIPYNERRTKFWEDVKKEMESVKRLQPHNDI